MPAPAPPTSLQFRAFLLGAVALMIHACLPAQAQSADSDAFVYFAHTGQIDRTPSKPELWKSGRKTVLKAGNITWNIVYEDQELLTGVGFDGANGAAARSTLNSVLSYLTNYLPYTASVDLLIRASETDASGPLGQAGSWFSGSVDGFNMGNLQKHIITGMDPSPGQEDAIGIFDFGYPWNFSMGPAGPGQYDFYSVALHEMMHALGFSTLTDSAGGSRLNNPLIPNARSFLDQFIETGNGTDLFSATGNGVFLGTVQMLAGLDGGLVLNHNQLILTYGSKPPLYAPNPFVSGSSMSHLDFAVANAVMHPLVSAGVTKRTLTAVEEKAFYVMGYLTETPSPTPSLTPTISPTPSPSPTPLPVNIGNARDVPTWRIGDQWAVSRTMRLELFLYNIVPGLDSALQSATARLDLSELYNLTVTRIDECDTTCTQGVFPDLTYVRERSGAVLQTNGTLISNASSPFPIELIAPTEGPGETWNRVGDLAESHESFNLKGRLRISGNGSFAPTTATLDLVDIDTTITIDYEPPQEWADFPLDYPGEEWLTRPALRVWGRMALDYPNFGDDAPGLLDILTTPGGIRIAAPPDQTLDFDTTLPQGFHRLAYITDGARQGYTNSRIITDNRGTDAVYAHGARDFVVRNLQSQLPLIVDDGGSNMTLLGRISDFSTLIQPNGATLQPQMNLSELSFTPLRGTPGGSVLMMGKFDAQTTYTATVLLTGQQVSGTTDGAGRFSTTILAPPDDDDSPATADGGSHGVLIESPGGSRVITVQLGGAGLTTSNNWAEYE